jgi:imidazolonepropionase-like amidohydrolase
LSGDLIEEMATRGTALVPTLINIARFPEIAAKGKRYPSYAAHMLALHKTVGRRILDAYDAGVPIYAGTDAGSEIQHGRIADEVIALHAAGLSSVDALGAASWKAREWLGVDSGVADGSEANFVVYENDPRALNQLRHPSFVVLRGQVFHA